MWHEKIVGRSGSGKTNYMLVQILACANLLTQGIGAVFPHPKAALQLIWHLFLAGHIDRVVVDDLRTNRKVIQKVYLRRSDDPNYFEQRSANESYRDAFLTLPARRRDMEKIANFAAIEKYSHLAAAVYQSLDAFLPLYLLPKILVQGHWVQLWAYRHCADEEAREELLRVIQFGTHDYVTLVLPAVRFLDGFFGRAHIMARSTAPATFDPAAHLKDCGDGTPGIYVVIGGGSKEAIQVNAASDSMIVALDAKMNPSEVVRHWWSDESTRYGLFHAFEADQVATNRAFNLFRHDALQNYNYASPEIEDDHRTNTESTIFRQGSRRMAEECAGDLLLSLDEYRVHHQEESTRTRTEYTERQKVTETSSTDHEGNKRKGTSVSTERVPQQVEFVERRDVYQTGGEQIFWKAQSLMRLLIGHCIKSNGDGQPYPCTVPLLTDPSVFEGDFEREVEECLEYVMSKPIYVTPKLFEAPAEMILPPPGRQKKEPGKQPKKQPSPRVKKRKS